MEGEEMNANSNSNMEKNEGKDNTTLHVGDLLISFKTMLLTSHGHSRFNYIAT